VGQRAASEAGHIANTNVGRKPRTTKKSDDEIYKTQFQVTVNWFNNRTHFYNQIIMKLKLLIESTCIFSVLIGSCNHTEKPLTHEEKEQIKSEVISSIEIHVKDIIKQDYPEVMKFYFKDDYILFGDGNYWGDYKTVDDIWGKWLPRWKQISKWELKNHKVHVFSRDAAIDYVEWIHERVEEDGDTTKAYGFWVWGMQRFPDGWKSVNAAIDHTYTAGPNVKQN
jgi:hypothetical protein